MIHKCRYLAYIPMLTFGVPQDCEIRGAAAEVRHHGGRRGACDSAIQSDDLVIDEVRDDLQSAKQMLALGTAQQGGTNTGSAG